MCRASSLPCSKPATAFEERYRALIISADEALAAMDYSAARGTYAQASDMQPEERLRSAIRFSFSAAQTRAEIDEAVQQADYVLFALPSMLGVDYNAHLFANLAAVARELGWKE